MRKKEDRRSRWKRLNPWARYVEFARRRCSPKKDSEKWHKFYSDKGVECHLTAEQLKEVWMRDEAWKLRRPSLDRKDSRFNYCNWNVRFIEFNHNSMIATNLCIASSKAKQAYYEEAIPSGG